MTFIRSVVIAAPVERVFAFHEREDALQLLSPAFPPVRLVSRTGGIKKGARVELRVGPLQWIACHTDYQKNRLFVDQQTRGPFKQWVHRHIFEAVGDQTRLTDHIEYQLPGGWFVTALFGWAVKLGLNQMFQHRHQVTKRLCTIAPAACQ